MDDIIVSIKIPEQMYERLKELVKEGNFLDTSEGVRSIVRDKWLEFQNPELSEIKNLREEIKNKLVKKSEKTVKKEVIEELRKIKELLK